MININMMFERMSVGPKGVVRPRFEMFDHQFFKHYIGGGIQDYTTMKYEQALASYPYVTQHIPKLLPKSILGEITVASWLAVGPLIKNQTKFLFQSQDDAAFFQLMLS